MEHNFFTIRYDGDFPRLRDWIRAREFNCINSVLHDKKGFPMVGLAYDRDPDNEWRFPEKTGLIWCGNGSIHQKVVEFLRERINKRGKNRR